MTPDYQFFIAGIVGGLIGAQMREGGIELPTLTHLKGKCGIMLSLGGIIGLAAAGLAGMYFDHTLWNAAIYGFSATILLERGGEKLLTAKGTIPSDLINK